MAYAWSPGIEDTVDPSFWDPVNPATMPPPPKASTPGRPIGRSREQSSSGDSVALSASMYSNSPQKFDPRDSTRSESVNMSMSLKPVLFDTPPRTWVKPPRPASLFESDKIPSLDKDNFYDTILKKEKALIMYSDSRVPHNGRVDLAFLHVAEKTKNEKYQFGFVDCAYNMPFCKQQKICKVPTLKLYSNGFEVSKMEDMTHFNEAHMRKLMSMAPVLKLPKKTTAYLKMLPKPKPRTASLDTISDKSLGMADITQDSVFNRTVDSIASRSSAANFLDTSMANIGDKSFALDAGTSKSSRSVRSVASISSPTNFLDTSMANIADKSFAMDAGTPKSSRSVRSVASISSPTNFLETSMANIADKSFAMNASPSMPSRSVASIASKSSAANFPNTSMANIADKSFAMGCGCRR